MGMNNTDPEQNVNAAKLFADKYNIRDKIVYNKTHVFIASQSYTKMIENAILDSKTKTTHISKNNYLDYFVGFVYNKNLNQFVAKHFNQM